MGSSRVGIRLGQKEGPLSQQWRERGLEGRKFMLDGFWLLNETGVEGVIGEVSR